MSEDQSNPSGKLRPSGRGAATNRGPRPEEIARTIALDYLDPDDDPWFHELAGDITAALKEAIAGAKPEWKTIDSAPNDGTHILACGVRGAYSPPTTVHWFGPADLPGLRAGGWYISVQQDEGGRVHPTYWMPLADPPNLPPEHQDEGK